MLFILLENGRSQFCPMPMKSKIASSSSKQQWGMGKTHDGAHHRMEYSTD